MKHRAFIIGLGNIGMMYDYNINKKDIALTHANALSNNKFLERAHLVTFFPRP